MTIRPATVSDVPAVLPMVQKICSLHEEWDPAKYGFLPNPERRYERWLAVRAEDPHSVFLVAEREADEARPAALVGFLVATVEDEIPIYRVKRFGFIHDTWVEPEYRQEGIGRQMTMLAVERFRQIGVEQVRADTSARNDGARRLLESCGFRASTVEMLREL